MLRWSTICRMSISKIKSLYRHWSLNGLLNSHERILCLATDPAEYLCIPYHDLNCHFLNLLGRLMWSIHQHMMISCTSYLLIPSACMEDGCPCEQTNLSWICTTYCILYIHVLYIQTHSIVYMCEKQFRIEKCIILFQKLKLFNTSNVAYA